MKIALLTIHWANNYGATLQVFATVQSLKKYGEVSVIDYRSEFTSKGMRLLRFGCKMRDVLRVGKDLFRLLPRYRVIKKFERFSYENFNMTRIVRTDYDFKALNKKFNVFVSGSDQIWNPKIISENGRIDGRYFLDFVEGNRKVAFASSIGTHQYTKAEQQSVTTLLARYDHLSVREKSSSNYLTNLLKRPVGRVVDPTLLLTKSDWLQRFTIDPNNDARPYILVYALKKDTLFKKVVEQVTNTLNLRVVAIDQDPFINFKCEKHIRDASPEEFLEMFANASFVVTNSFHGTAFSVNFNIPFIVTTPPTGINRIQDLLMAVGAPERIVDNATDAPGLVVSKMRFSGINSALESLRIESNRYIENAFT